MFAILVIPILICGIIWIKSHPSKSLKIGTFQGWLIYLYAAKYGFYFLTTIYFASDFIIPFIFKTEFFQWLIDGVYIFSSLEKSIKGSSFQELSVLNIFSQFLLKSSFGSEVDLVDPEHREAFVNAKIIALSLVSFLICLVLGFCTNKVSLLRGKTREAIAEIYAQNSPSDYLLLMITDNFIEEKKLDDKIKRKIDCYNKTRSTTPKDELKRQAKRSALLNKIIVFIYNKIGYKERIPPEFKDAKKLYRLYLVDEKEFYENLQGSILEPEDRMFSLITMRSRKVYIGVSLATGTPDEEGVSNKEVLILPYFSGYRSEDSMGLNITNRYLVEHGDHSDVDLISLPKAEITSVSAFSMSMFNKIEKNMVKEKRDAYFINNYIKSKRREKN